MVTINLIIRFILELVMLGVIGYWGSRNGDGASKIILAVGLPLIAAAIWVTFAVPNDPSRSGKAPVPVPGIVRLFIELALFAISMLIIYSQISHIMGIIYGIVVLINYFIAHERLVWIIKK